VGARALPLDRPGRLGQRKLPRAGHAAAAPGWARAGRRVVAL